MTQGTWNRRRTLAIGVGALLVGGAFLGRRSLTGRAAGGGGGCEGQDYEAPHTGSTKQKAEGTVDPAQIFSGAQAALTVVTMLRDFANTGVASATPAQVLAAVKQLQQSINALSASVADLKVAIGQTNVDVIGVPAKTLTNNIVTLWDAYTLLKTKLDTALDAGTDAGDAGKELDQLLAGLKADGQSSYGNLTWPNLLDLSDYTIGGGTVSSSISLILQGEIAKGEAGIPNDTLGHFMADRLLMQEKAFFILSRAHEGSSAVDLAQERKKLDIRTAAQKEAFFVATRTYNASLFNKANADRAATIAGCLRDGHNGQVEYSFYDNFAAQKVPVPHPNTCDEYRVAYIRTAVLKAIDRVRVKLEAAEEVYNLLSPTGSFTFTPDAGQPNDWQKVTIKNVDEKTFVWTNAAGVKWSLTRLPGIIDRLQVGADCPYYANGYVEAKIIFAPVNAGAPNYGEVIGITGPDNQIYARVP